MSRDVLGRPVITAAELESMTPEQRRAHFEASIVRDLGALPAEYMAGLRADAEDLVTARGVEHADPGSAGRGIPTAS